MYSTQVTATHKVTGRSKTFTLVVNPKAQFVAVKPNDGRDRTSWIEPAAAWLLAQGVSSVGVAYDSFTVNEILEKLDNDNNYIFISESHGYVDETNPEDGSEPFVNDYGLVITEESDDIENIIFRATDMSTGLDLSNMGIVVFVGCKTTKVTSGTFGTSLTQRVIDRGAKCAVGFNDNILNSDANIWVEKFTMYLDWGYSVEEARARADNFEKYIDPGIRSSQAFGQIDLILG